MGHQNLKKVFEINLKTEGAKNKKASSRKAEKSFSSVGHKILEYQEFQWLTTQSRLLGTNNTTTF